MAKSHIPAPLLFATLLVCTAASIARAAAFQPTLDTTGNAVGSTITDTGVATALQSKSRRALLQASSGIPNYATSSSGPTDTSSAGSSNQNPSAAFSQSQDQSGSASSPGSADQNPFAGSSPAAGAGPTAADTSTASSSSGTVIRDSASQASPAEPVPVLEKPPPVGPDPADWQQTEDFPPGTRLTHAQGTLLLLGRGFHGR